MNCSNSKNKDDPENILQTCPADARFINQNVTAWCFSTFVDHRRCQRLLGEKNNHCVLFEKIYKSICPNAWIARWEEQLKAGTFPVDLPAPRKK